MFNSYELLLIFYNFLQALDGPETKNSSDDSTELALFIKRFHNSSYTTDPMQEIIIDSPTTECLRQKVSKFYIKHIKFFSASRAILQNMRSSNNRVYSSQTALLSIDQTFRTSQTKFLTHFNRFNHIRFSLPRLIIICLHFSHFIFNNFVYFHYNIKLTFI